MAAFSSDPRQPLARHAGSPLHGLASLWWRCAVALRAERSPEDGRSWRRIAFKLSIFAGLALLGAFWGSAVAVAELNALYLCVSLIGCVFILLDFRIGVVLLILLMPISRSTVFPHEMLGIIGLNPANLLLLGTLGSCLLLGLSDSRIRRFMPRPLLWLYIVPFLLSGALGSLHVGDIAPHYYINHPTMINDATGYIRDFVVKPLFLVVFALLVGAAVAKS